MREPSHVRVVGGRHENRPGEAHRRDEHKPDQPTEIPRRAWPGVLRRTLNEYKADNLGDLAAALTYYGVLAIFPMLIVIVSLLGLIGHSVTQSLIQNIGKAAPSDARTIFTNAIRSIQSNRSAAGIAFVVGLAVALWSASRYIAAFMRASNVVWGVEEGRPIWKTIPLRLTVMVITVLLLTLAAIPVVFTGGLAQRLGNVIGVGSSAVTIWDIAKWPVLLLVVAFILAVLYWAGPNVKQPGFRWVTPGGVVAVALWVLASGALAFYVANFSSYNKTYGALASVPGLAMDHQHGDPAWSRAQRRDRARTPDRGRPATRPRAFPATA